MFGGFFIQNDSSKQTTLFKEPHETKNQFLNQNLLTFHFQCLLLQKIIKHILKGGVIEEK